MGRIPTMQSREMMAKKKALAVRLLGQGLTNYQIAQQLRCSTAFVRRVREELRTVDSREILLSDAG